MHAALQKAYDDEHLGASLGVLAGDFASTYAWELFLSAPYPTQVWPTASALFLSIQKEVYCGQHLDLTGDPDVSRMHALKTTSYSVRGPLLLGGPPRQPLHGTATSASGPGPDRSVRRSRSATISSGALGSAEATGKPGMDVAHGKVSSVIAELRRSTATADRQPVESIFGHGDATDSQLREAHACLRELGVVDRLGGADPDAPQRRGAGP